MGIGIINRAKSIVVPILPVNQQEIVTVYQSPDLVILGEEFSDYKILSFNCFLKNLKAYASIGSLPEAPIPNFLAEDTQTDRLMKTLDAEWKSPRKQLDLHIGIGYEWSPVGGVSFLNPYGYPYRTYNLLDLFTAGVSLELGSDSKVGASMTNVGNGVVTVQDRVTIHGSYVEEIIVEFPDPQPIINVYGSIGETPSPKTLDVGNNAYVDNDFLLKN